MPTLAEMRAQGFEPEDYEDEDDFDVWPENWPIFQVFCAVRTQWRSGGNGGATGLDYATVYPLLERKGFTGQAFFDALDDIQTMEFAALEVLNRKRKRS